MNEKQLKIIILILVVILFSAASIYLFRNINLPKKIATEYLKAIQMHNDKKLTKLSSPENLRELYKKGELINLMDWKFINKKKIKKEKLRLDLSERAFKEWLKRIRGAETGHTIIEIYKSKYETDNYYEAWRLGQIEDKKAFKEEGNFYYYKPINRVEYLLDITCTNKLGMRLKHKYILVLEKDYLGKWKVIKFNER